MAIPFPACSKWVGEAGRPKQHRAQACFNAWAKAWKVGWVEVGGRREGGLGRGNADHGS